LLITPPGSKLFQKETDSSVTESTALPTPERRASHHGLEIPKASETFRSVPILSTKRSSSTLLLECNLEPGQQAVVVNDNGGCCHRSCPNCSSRHWSLGPYLFLGFIFGSLMTTFFTLSPEYMIRRGHLSKVEINKVFLTAGIFGLAGRVCASVTGKNLLLLYPGQCQGYAEVGRLNLMIQCFLGCVFRRLLGHLTSGSKTNEDIIKNRNFLRQLKIETGSPSPRPSTLFTKSSFLPQYRMAFHHITGHSNVAGRITTCFPSVNVQSL